MEVVALDDARYQFEVNLFGLARLTQLVLPFMRERRAGKIVNISSIGGGFTHLWSSNCSAEIRGHVLKPGVMELVVDR